MVKCTFACVKTYGYPAIEATRIVNREMKNNLSKSPKEIIDLVCNKMPRSVDEIEAYFSNGETHKIIKNGG